MPFRKEDKCSWIRRSVVPIVRTRNPQNINECMMPAGTSPLRTREGPGKHRRSFASRPVAKKQPCLWARFSTTHTGEPQHQLEAHTPPRQPGHKKASLLLSSKKVPFPVSSKPSTSYFTYSPNDALTNVRYSLFPFQSTIKVSASAAHHFTHSGSGGSPQKSHFRGMAVSGSL